MLSARSNKAMLEARQKRQGAEQVKAEAMDAKMNVKMARIEKLQAIDAKAAYAERQQKLKELSERQKQLRLNAKVKPVTAEAKKNGRAFI